MWVGVLNSGHQAWWQDPLPTKPSSCSTLNVFNSELVKLLDAELEDTAPCPLFSLYWNSALVHSGQATVIFVFFILHPTEHLQADLILPFHCLFVNIVKPCPRAGCVLVHSLDCKFLLDRKHYFHFPLQIYIFYYKNDNAELKITCYIKKKSIKE